MIEQGGTPEKAGEVFTIGDNFRFQPGWVGIHISKGNWEEGENEGELARAQKQVVSGIHNFYFLYTKNNLAPRMENGYETHQNCLFFHSVGRQWG